MTALKLHSSADFRRCLPIVWALEGIGISKKNPTGYVNHPKDPGGETNFGICRKSYPHLDIRGLTEAQARDIYYQDYWVPSGAEGLPWPLQCAYFDCAVNQGRARARTLLRATHDFEEFLLERIRAYENLAQRNPKAAFWLPAWRNRIKRLRKLIQGSNA